MLNILSKRLMVLFWPALPLWYRMYRLALGVGLFAVLQGVILHQQGLSTFCLYLFCVLICTGFITWLTAIALRVFRHEVSRTAVTLLHAGVLLGAYLCSRWCVALATGLPSKDLDGSVAVTTIVCAILLYIILAALFSLVIAICCLAVAPVLESAWLLSRMPSLTLLRDHLGKRFGMRLFDEPEPRPRPTRLDLASHLVGGVLVSYLCACAFQLALDLSINDSQLMKHLAYYADYQLADRYPGILVGERFVLHDNNVISFARLIDGRVEIGVGVIDPQKGITEISPYQ